MQVSAKDFRHVVRHGGKTEPPHVFKPRPGECRRVCVCGRSAYGHK